MKITNEGPLQGGKIQHQTHEKLPENVQLLRSSKKIAQILLQKLKAEKTRETQSFLSSEKSPRERRRKTTCKTRPKIERIFATSEMTSSPSPLTCNVGLSKTELNNRSEKNCDKSTHLSGRATDMDKNHAFYPKINAPIADKTCKKQPNLTNATATHEIPRISSKVKDRTVYTTIAGRTASVTTFLFYLPILIFILICPNSLCNAYPTAHDSSDPMQASSQSSSNKLFTQEDIFLWPTRVNKAPEHQVSSLGGHRRIERSAKRSAPKHLTRHGSSQQLQNRYGYFLEITRNGEIRGTMDKNNPYTEVRMSSSDIGVVVIYGKKSNLFLAMNRKGYLFASKKYTDECDFEEKFRGRFFTYQAVKRRSDKRRFVGISWGGHPKRGNRSKGNNRAALFLPMPYKGI